ncbi:MAG: two-component system, NarL family, sensor kinase [Acidobacteriaceae bacterium]|nr:two-component system, NarL family, sensor kinase [Acidobacteriaceae bacterium]
MPKRTKQPAPSARVTDLLARVAELEETLRAIRMGEVDAVLVSGPQGDQVFTLQGAEHPYRLMVETIDEGAATLSDDGTVLYANRSFAEIFDIPLEKVIGAPLNDFVFGEDRKLLANLIADANINIVRGEIRLDSHRQRPRTIRLTLSPVREQGVHTICVVATELTELIETNEALRVSELSLRQLSARLLKLQDEERRRIARDLHDTTGQKIAVLSMTLDRLAKLVDTKKVGVKDALTESRDVVGKIGEEIRTLSYLLHPPLLDECGLASAVLWYAEGFKKRSGIHLNVAIDEELVRLTTDAETALFRVLQESLTNVHRYSGSASAEIRIFQSPSKVHLEIVDHGKGVKAGTEPSAFAGAPTLGVGIPGMRERIRQLGGQLEVEFSKDGTRVHASLPREGLAAESTEPSTSELFRRPDVRKRIMIADDHEVMRRGVRGLVESQEEWSVCGEAIEGIEAISKTRELHPDLLILDISMPGMSGIEAAQRILKDDPSIKILFFTMHDSPQMMREISNVGAWGYVAKARAGNDLVDAVRIILEGKKFFPRIATAS